MNVLNIFVCADKEDRILRIMQKDHLDHDSAREKVEKTDEERAAYYYEHTGKTWGDVNDYHMILDTSELGVENCADILLHYFEKLEYIYFPWYSCRVCATKKECASAHSFLLYLSESEL